MSDRITQRMADFQLAYLGRRLRLPVLVRTKDAMAFLADHGLAGSHNEPGTLYFDYGYRTMDLCQVDDGGRRLEWVRGLKLRAMFDLLYHHGDLHYATQRAAKWVRTEGNTQ